MSSLNNTSSINIKQLPESYNIEPVDFIIIDNSQGTEVICFDNMVFDIEQMAFENEFDQQTTDLRSLSAEVTSIYDDLSAFVDEELTKVYAVSGDIIKILEQAML